MSTEEELSEPLKGFVHELSTIHIPTKVIEALKDPKWVLAMKEEMKALEKNQTWTLEKLPQGKRDYWMQMGVHCETQC